MRNSLFAHLPKTFVYKADVLAIIDVYRINVPASLMLPVLLMSSLHTLAAMSMALTVLLWFKCIVIVGLSLLIPSQYTAWPVLSIISARVPLISSVTQVSSHMDVVCHAHLLHCCY